MAFYFLTSEDALHELEQLQNAPYVGLDIETAGQNGLNPHQSRIRLIQLATEHNCYVVDLDKVDAREAISPILTNEACVKVIHNAKFDIKHIYHHWGIWVGPTFCTFLASKLLAMGRGGRRHGLASVAKQYLDVNLDKTMQNSDWAGELNEEQVQYAAADAEVLARLYPLMNEKLRASKLNKVSQLEFRTVIPVAAMELKGIRVDLDKWGLLRDQLRQKSRALEEELEAQLMLPGSLPGMNTINLNAPEQVREALANMGVQVSDTAEATLRPLAQQYPIIARFLEYRHYGKILGATLKQIEESVLPETGRVHASYHQIASASGRFACSEPNIQQVPREAEVRSCFVPEPGYRYIIADYSQVELRVAAGISGDSIMTKAYKEGRDLHRLTAGLTQDKDPEAVTKEERQAAKAINFGLIYAMGAKGLQQSAKSSYGVEMSLDEATRFRERFFQNYSGIKAWQRNTERIGRQSGYIRTRGGRIRSYQGEEVRLTELLNIPVQGTAAEGFKSAMCIFWDSVETEKVDAAIVAIIHDEIIVEAKAEQAERAKQLLEDAMVRGISWLVPEIPFEAEAAIVDSWADK